jgi:CHAD domain-containing protein
MAFKFKNQASVRKAIRRLVRRQIEKALRELRRDDRLKAVHGVRKEIKKLRAMLRLVRSAMARSSYRKYSNALREAAAHLGAARDAHVRVSALAELASRSKPAANPFGRISRMLHENCRQEQAGFVRAHAPRKVRRALKRFARQFASVSLKKSGWADLAPGLKRTYRDGRRGYQAALESSTPASFHEWRKRVKDLYYQTALLRRIWPEQMMASEADLKRLGQCLGKDHDLFLLTELSTWTHLQEEAKDEALALKALVNQRQTELRVQALELGARLYAEKPSLVCKRIGGYWQRWRHAPGRIRKSQLLHDR